MAHLLDILTPFYICGAPSDNEESLRHRKIYFFIWFLRFLGIKKDNKNFLMSQGFVVIGGSSSYKLFLYINALYQHSYTVFKRLCGSLFCIPFSFLLCISSQCALFPIIPVCHGSVPCSQHALFFVSCIQKTSNPYIKWCNRKTGIFSIIAWFYNCGIW